MYAEQALQLVHDARRTENLPHLPPYNTTVIRAVTKEVRDLDREINTLLAPFAINNTNNSNTARSSTSSFNPHEHPQLACTLLVNQLSMRRNKRCLLAYHRTRTEKLEGFCWEGRDVVELGNLAASNSNSNLNMNMNLDDNDDDENINNNQNQNINNSNNNNTISETTTTTMTTSTLSSEEEQYTHAYSSLLAAYKGQWTEIDLTGSVEPPQDIFIDVRVLKDAGEIQTEYGSITLTKNSQFYVRAGDVEGLVRQGYLQKLG